MQFLNFKPKDNCFYNFILFIFVNIVSLQARAGDNENDAKNRLERFMASNQEIIEQKDFEDFFDENLDEESQLTDDADVENGTSNDTQEGEQLIGYYLNNQMLEIKKKYINVAYCLDEIQALIGFEEDNLYSYKRNLKADKRNIYILNSSLLTTKIFFHHLLAVLNGQKPIEEIIKEHFADHITSLIQFRGLALDVLDDISHNTIKRSVNTLHKIIRDLLYYLKEQNSSPLKDRISPKLVALITISSSLHPFLNKENDDWVEVGQDYKNELINLINDKAGVITESSFYDETLHISKLERFRALINSRAKIKRDIDANNNLIKELQKEINIRKDMNQPDVSAIPYFLNTGSDQNLIEEIKEEKIHKKKKHKSKKKLLQNEIPENTSLEKEEAYILDSISQEVNEQFNAECAIDEVSNLDKKLEQHETSYLENLTSQTTDELNLLQVQNFHYDSSLDETENEAITATSSLEYEEQLYSSLKEDYAYKNKHLGKKDKLRNSEKSKSTNNNLQIRELNSIKVSNQHAQTIYDIFRINGYTSLNSDKIISAWMHVLGERGHHKINTGSSHQPLYAQLLNGEKVVFGLFISDSYGPNYIKYIREAFNQIGFGQAWLQMQGYLNFRSTQLFLEVYKTIFQSFQVNKNF